MKARNGQVALYLIAVLVAIAVLIFMNVDVFLAVRAKNHATNAGDAAALAVARYQGELLNEIGHANIDHLKAILENDVRTCDEIMERQRERVFLGPLAGIRIGGQAAKNALSDCESGGGVLPEGFECEMSGHRDDGMKKILQQHVSDIYNVFMTNPDLYPEPWEGAWQRYAEELQAEIGGGVIAGPENAEFADAYSCFPLLEQAFYNAVAGEMWCWFKWNGMWLFDCDHNSMPKPVYPSDRTRDNSEVYSLHLKIQTLPQVLDQEWTNVILRLTECTERDIADSWLLTNGTQKLAFYEAWQWSSWKERGFSVEYGFPIVGDVKPEYDVYGCAALCRVVRVGAEVDDDEEQVRYSWTAAAKPFGVVENLDGETDVVTCLKRLVVPAFTDVRLVPIDSVGGRDLHTADWDWMKHVRDHLPQYFLHGPLRGDCWYCLQLSRWENPAFRGTGKRWLQYHADECVRPRPGNSPDHGGTAHAH